MLNRDELSTLNDIHCKVEVLKAEIDKVIEEIDSIDFFSADFDAYNKRLRDLFDHKENLRKQALTLLGF